MQCDLSVSDIFQAYYDCRKAKRNTWSAIEFEQNLERNLMDLYYELKDQSYQPGQSIMFVVTKPKAREVWAANFRDRVVHHVLYTNILGIFTGGLFTTVTHAFLKRVRLELQTRYSGLLGRQQKITPSLHGF